MKNILLLNKIATTGLDNLDPSEYNVGENIASPDGVLVRSASMHDMPIPESLLAVARAGAGVNNIPFDDYSKKGIVVFNTPGANANGVKELALCALMLASRDIIGGVEWAKTLTSDVARSVEKGKSKFAGSELKGKKLGVIGLGAIGGLVANSAVDLEMKVIGCDPYLSIEAAWNLDHNIIKATAYEDIYKQADYITLHVPATPQTKNMINAESLSMMKDGVKIINLSRSDLVNAADLKMALASGKVSAYVTDFPTEDILDVPGVVAIPHLGASTEESENNCAAMAARQLDDYLQNGNIKNSVNYPSVSMPRSGKARICLLHSNIPAMLSQITSTFSENRVNIENLLNKSRGDVAYTIVDVAEAVTDRDISKLRSIDGMIKVRVL